MLRNCAPSGPTIRRKSPSFESAAPTVNGHVEEVLAHLCIVGEATRREDDRLTGGEARRAAVTRRGLDADDGVAGGDHPLDAVSGSGLDAVALGRGAQRADRHLPAVGHRLAGVGGHENPAGRRGVLVQLGPVVRDFGTVAVDDCAALVQQLGRRGRRLVDRSAQVELPRCHSERRAVGVIGLWPRQPGHVTQKALLGVLDAERLHRLVVGDPVPERRLSGGAPKVRRLLQQYDVVAQPASEERGRQATATATDDDDIDLGVEIRRTEPGGAHWSARLARSELRCGHLSTQNAVWGVPDHDTAPGEPTARPVHW
jgi:hypothetical protein